MLLSYRVHLVEGLTQQDEAPCLPATPLASPAARRLRDWWWAEAGQGLPLRSRFDILSHAGAVQDVFLVEALPDGSFLNRIVGERAQQRVEPGRTGSLITPDDPAEFKRILHRLYGRVALEKTPIRSSGRLLCADSVQHVYEGLDCPLSQDGETVSHIIGILSVVPGA